MTETRNQNAPRIGFSAHLHPTRKTWKGICLFHGISYALCEHCGGRRPSTGRGYAVAAQGAHNTRDGWPTERG